MPRQIQPGRLFEKRRVICRLLHVSAIILCVRVQPLDPNVVLLRFLAQHIKVITRNDKWEATLASRRGRISVARHGALLVRAETDLRSGRPQCATVVTVSARAQRRRNRSFLCVFGANSALFSSATRCYRTKYDCPFNPEKGRKFQ